MATVKQAAEDRNSKSRTSDIPLHFRINSSFVTKRVNVAVLSLCQTSAFIFLWDAASNHFTFCIYQYEIISNG